MRQGLRTGKSTTLAAGGRFRIRKATPIKLGGIGGREASHLVMQPAHGGGREASQLVMQPAHGSAQTPSSTLQAPSAFSSISDPAERSRATFAEAAKVLTHPRFLNCHPMGDRPTQANDVHPHEPVRHPRRTADQIRSRHQSNHREGARHRGAADAARPRRRGDRMKMLFAAVHESASGTSRRITVSARVRTLSDVKRTLLARRARVDPKRLPRKRHQCPCYSRSSKPTLSPHPCGISQVCVSCFKGTALQCSIPGGNPCETLSHLRSPSPPPRSSASITTAVWRKNKQR